MPPMNSDEYHRRLSTIETEVGKLGASFGVILHRLGEQDKVAAAQIAATKEIDTMLRGDGNKVRGMSPRMETLEAGRAMGLRFRWLVLTAFVTAAVSGVIAMCVWLIKNVKP